MFDVTFNNVSPTAFENFREHLTGVLEGTHVDEGTVDCQGVRCSYRYDEAGKSLGVSVLSTPRVVTQGYVIGWLHDALRKHGHKVESTAKGGE